MEPVTLTLEQIKEFLSSISPLKEDRYASERGMTGSAIADLLIFVKHKNTEEILDFAWKKVP